MAAVLLQCGHTISEVIEVDGETVCGACSDSEPVDVEAVEEEPTAIADTGEERQDADGGEGAEVTVLTPPQPAYGTRNSEPGPRGCWALNTRGEPCGSFKRRDSDFCTAHTGLGIGTDPKRWSGEAHAARREQLATRATLRLAMGDRGRLGPRALLRAEVDRKAERLAVTSVKAALDPETDPVKAAHLALKLIETADPPAQSTLEISGPLSAEAMEGMSLAQLLAVAESQGIDLSRPEPMQLPTIEA